MVASGVACSTPGDSDLASGEYADPHGAASSGGDGAPDDVGEGGTGTGTDPTDGTGGTEGGSTDAGSGGADMPPSPGDASVCPSRLPEAWVFCEDFETIGDPYAVFFDYSDGEGAFEITHDGGASGLGAMRATYRAGVEAAGFVSVSFGQSPIDTGVRPGYDPDVRFDEIYWRFRVKMEAGWPDAGPHQLTKAMTFAGSDWGQAMVASLTSDGDDVTLIGSGATCVEGAEVACQGYDDTASMEPLQLLPGQTPLFSEALSGRWHCVEAHVKLNTPGVPDGAFEFWVDGALENGSNSIDWRGVWDAYGLNLITIENFWIGGAPYELERSIDDIVISTEPIGCDPPQ